ncbi:MAG: hypothetical protein EOP23_19440 [Hyphomicrobiales bacterium]|nr:MAG: hypothetical protein EOP23_19440 [Hyphomicrobiales bacterium]
MSDIDYDLGRIDRMVAEARTATDPAEALAIRHAAIVELLSAILLQLGEIRRTLEPPPPAKATMKKPPKKKPAGKRATKKKAGAANEAI